MSVQPSLLTNVKIKTFKKQEIIFRENQPSDNNLYLVISGSVYIIQQREGKQQIINTLDRSDFFGEIALLMNTPRTASAMAASENVKLACFDKESFIKETHKNVKLTFHLSRKIISRIMYLENQLKAEQRLEAVPIEKYQPERIKSIRYNNLKLSALVTTQHEVFVYEGKKIFDELRENTEEIYFITQGEIELSYIKNDKKFIITNLKKGDFFGLDAFNPRQTRTLTATVISKQGKIIFMDKKMLVSAAQIRADMFYNFFKGIVYYQYALESFLFRDQLAENEALL